MIASWNIGGLLRDLALRHRHPAVIAFAVEGSETWDSATVADKALRLARGLRDTGVGTGTRVALWAPNSPVWIVGALAVLSAGGVVVPIDDLADAEQLKAALVSSAAQAIFTTARHLESSNEILGTHAGRVILVDEDEGDRRLATGWLKSNRRQETRTLRARGHSPFEKDAIRRPTWGKPGQTGGWPKIGGVLRQ